MTREDVWKQYYESDPSLFDGGLDENDLAKIQQYFYDGFDFCATELENKIADIKANCDLAIEGRDIKIQELELELTVQKDQLQEETNLHLHAEEYIKSLEKENEMLKGDLELWESGGCRATNLFKCGVVKELKEQIEKMKRHCNCKHRDSEGYCEVKRTYLMDLSYDGCDKWELED